METVVAGIALLVIGTVAAVLAKVLGVDVDIGVDPLRFRVTRAKKPAAHPTSILPPVEPPAPSSGSEVERERDQLREALFSYGEAALALEALLGCEPVHADTYAHAWFDSLSVGLATALRTSTGERYRVSIWSSNDDPSNFDAIGLGRFEGNDKRIMKLNRTGFRGDRIDWIQAAAVAA